MIELAIAMLIGGWGFWVATEIAEEKAEKAECPCEVLEEYHDTDNRDAEVGD